MAQALPNSIPWGVLSVYLIDYLSQVRGVFVREDVFKCVSVFVFVFVLVFVLGRSVVILYSQLQCWWGCLVQEIGRAHV